MDVSHLVIAVVSIVLTLIGSSFMLAWRISSVTNKLSNAIVELAGEVKGIKGLVHAYKEQTDKDIDALKTKVFK